MEELTVRSHKEKEVLDITDEVQEMVANSKVVDGLCHLFVMHTTAAITAADMDNGTDLDMLDFLETIAPDLNYRHPHNPAHVKYHILSSIIGPSMTVPIQDGKLELGVWQRIILVELGGPRERSINVTIQ